MEVECRTLEDVEEALDAGADRLLLDNMDPGELREAASSVGRARGARGVGRHHPQSLRSVAGTGVQFVSMGR